MTSFTGTGANSSIIARQVISKPGAAIRVTRLVLSESAKANLNIGNAKIPAAKPTTKR